MAPIQIAVELLFENTANKVAELAGAAGQRAGGFAGRTMQGGGAFDAVAGPQGRRQEQMVRGLGQIAKQLPGAGMMESMAGAFKSGGIMGVMGAGIAGILGFVKQIMESSKVFQTIGGSFFKIFGAMADLFLLPFLPLAMRGMQALLQWMPEAQRWGQKAADKLMEFVELVKTEGFWSAIGIVLQKVWNGYMKPTIEWAAKEASNKIAQAIPGSNVKERDWSLSQKAGGGLQVLEDSEQKVQERLDTERAAKDLGTEFTFLQKVMGEGTGAFQSTYRALGRFGEKLHQLADPFRMLDKEYGASRKMDFQGPGEGSTGLDINVGRHVRRRQENLSTFQGARPGAEAGAYSATGSAMEGTGFEDNWRQTKQHGGMVRGGPGQGVPAMLHGGEMVIPRGMVGAMQSAQGSILGGFFGGLGEMISEEVQAIQSFVTQFRAKEAGAGGTLQRWNDSVIEGSVPATWDYLASVYGHMGDEANDQMKNAQSAFDSMSGLEFPPIPIPQITVPDISMCLDRLGNCLNQSFGNITRQAQEAVGVIQAQTSQNVDINVDLPTIPSEINMDAGSNAALASQGMANQVSNLFNSAAVGIKATEQKIKAAAENVAAIITTAGVSFDDSLSNLGIAANQYGGIIKNAGVFLARKGQLKPIPPVQKWTSHKSEKDKWITEEDNPTGEALAPGWSIAEGDAAAGIGGQEDFIFDAMAKYGTNSVTASEQGMSDYNKYIKEYEAEMAAKTAARRAAERAWDEAHDDDYEEGGGSDEGSSGSSESADAASEAAESVASDDYDDWWDDEGYYSGGIVRGRTGKPRLVRAHGGERILPNSSPSGGGGARVSSRRTMNITINSRSSVTEILGDLERMESMDEASFFNSTI